MVRGQCTMPRGQLGRHHANNHDVLFTDVRDDKCLMLRRRVSGHAGLPTDVAVFSLVLGVVRLSFVFGTHVRDILALFISSFGLWRRGRLLCKIAKSEHGLGRRGSGFPVPGRARSIVSIDREVDVPPRQELAAPNFGAVPVLTRRPP